MIHEQKINGVPAEVIAAAIDGIAAKEGVCHPARLVEKARPARSPLHPLFDWDDKSAADHWRVEQARRVIRTVRLVVEEQADPVPAYVHVTRVTAGGVANGYMDTRTALRGDTREAVIADVLAQLNGLKIRYQQLSELEKVWEALEEFDLEQAA